MFIAVFTVSTYSWNSMDLMFISETSTAIVPNIIALTIADINMIIEKKANSGTVLGATSLRPNVMTEWYMPDQ